VSEERLRADVLLHRLCLVRSRNEAKQACEAGAVRADERPVRASQEVGAGVRLEIRFPTRLLEIEVLALPGKSISRRAARELYRVVRDEPAGGPS
jgi:ribosomal 50S subunit-recycling heat shock protein